MNAKIDHEWLLRMAEKEGNGIISVGGLAARIGRPAPDRDALFLTTLRTIAKRQANPFDRAHIEAAADELGRFYAAGVPTP